MSFWTKNFFLLILSALALNFYPTVLLAQDAPPKDAIEKIIIINNKRVETNTIKSFLGIEVGDEVTNEKIDKALGSIFETGLFADVKIKVDKNNLVVKVVENPIIAEISFEGNKRIEDSLLESEIRLKPRSVYTKTDLQHDVRRVLDIYQKSGRFSASVVPKVIQLDKNRVNLVFEVDEGDRSKIRKISFVGNSNFNDEKLRKAVKTKESRWYRFFSGYDNYDPDRLDFDRELLRRFYVSHGYADFRVLSINAELSPDKQSFIITFTVEEGDKYHFGDLTAESKLRDLKDEQLAELISAKKGDIFDAEKIEETINDMTEFLGNLGYAFVDIEPEYKQDKEKNLVGLNFLVKEGPRVYIDKINVRGNVRTMDKVVRREFRIAEGDPYNADKIKRSQQRINNLGFFKNVDLKNTKSTSKDKVNIDVAVEEQSTGELTFGAGFSTTDGALGDISVSERNLLGKGQFLKLNFTLASVRQELDLSFTEPYFMDKNFATGFDLFNIKQDGGASNSNRTFDNETIGGAIRGSYPITEYIKHSIKYSYRSDDITDIDPDASLFIKKQEGKNTTSLIGHSIMIDSRDNKFRPTEGYYLRFNQDVAGLGGDNKFFRNELRGGYYYPLFNDDWVLKLVAKTGYILGFGGEDVRINDRFFIGGNDIRGFDSDGIGPRDETSKDPLGGNAYLASTVEMTFPLGLPEELGFTGSVFTDMGTLFDVDETDTVNDDGSVSRVLDESSIRASLGAGVSWKSPMGPIRIDFAYPFMDEAFDQTENIRFSFGTRF